MCYALKHHKQSISRHGCFLNNRCYSASFVFHYLERVLYLPVAIYYLLGLFCLSIVLGIQVIMLPWLVVDYLLLNSVWVGWIQAAVLIPNLLLLLLGGVAADRGHGTRWLVSVIIINGFIHGGLALLVANTWLSIMTLMAYAGLLGVVNAFIQPWREYLLKSIESVQLQTMVAKSSLCQHTGQALGVGIASLMLIFDVSVLLVVQFLIMLIAAYCFGQLSGHHTISQPSTRQEGISYSSLMKSGLADIWQLPVLRSLLLIVAFNGFFHIGVFIVALPLLAHQLYGANVGFYSAFQLAFIFGTITTASIVVLKKQLDAPGRRVAFSLLYGGVILLAISAQPTLWGLLALLFLWGVVVGVSANMGRTILQALAPENCRGRMIAIYQLALFGCAPLGALCAGYMIQWLGVIALLQWSGIASCIAFAMTLLTRELWAIEVDNVDA